MSVASAENVNCPPVHSSTSVAGESRVGRLLSLSVTLCYNPPDSPSLILACFACRGRHHEPSGLGGGSVDGRVVLRLTPAGVERVEWVLQSRTA